MRLATASRRGIISVVLAVAGVLGACFGERGIVWQGDRPADVALLALAPGELAVLDPTPAGATAPGDPAACRGSLRTLQHRGIEHAVWWSLRPEGRARLVAAHTIDGAPWSSPVAIDTLDRSHAGCDRPPPAIAVDTVTGYVSVSYFMQGPEGAGVFYAHSMSHGQTFEWPVAIVYGDRPSHSAVSAEASVVAVAYEDPNTPGPRISVAISLTDGHRFELRPRPLSGASRRAAAPAVTVRGRRVTVAWSERALGAAPESAVRVARIGMLGDER